MAESSLQVAPTEKKVATAAPTLRKSKPTASAAGPKASRWLARISIDNIALLLFSCIFLLHLGALSLFTRGFLLKRTTLEARNECDPSSTSCVLEPKFDRAVILLVDALRYDFLFPIDPASAKFDAAHHNHLAVPIALSTISPAHSIMYKSIADPPTTTLQRLKAITTGSLPTFVDAGSNFAGSRVDEDNWLEQANRMGKRIAFMGDDTWLTIFPEEVFASNHSFPFDSFNVEDLDTVDAGVRQHIIPLLDQSPLSSSWDILIAHPLGLDHAGHRFGASHGQTTRKLRETNDLIEQIVERLAEKDLLIVMGDHGMDSKGDHGGDSPEEVESALWLYSKTALVPDSPFSATPFGSSESSLGQFLETPAENDATEEFFQLDGTSQRRVSQISLVPTLSLLLGIPLSLNNLGTLIPELFLSSQPKTSRWSKAAANSDTLSQAFRINAEQMQTYLVNYASHSGGSDLAPSVPTLLRMYEEAASSSSEADAFRLYRNFTYATLRETRRIWARFDPISMGAGLAVLLGSLLVLMHLYKLSKTHGALWKTGALRLALSQGILAALVGAPVGGILWGITNVLRIERLGLLQTVILSTCLASEIGLVAYRPETVGKSTINSQGRQVERWLSVILLALHAIGFASNSYILWEDWVVLYLGQIQPLLLLLRATQAEDPQLRNRIVKMSLLAMCANRIMSFSTVCREEQHPYCKATFYGNSGVSVSSPSAIIAAAIAAFVLPSIIGHFLDLSKSRQGWAPFFLRYSFRGLLIGGVSYWVADYLEHVGSVAGSAKLFKITMARVLMMFGILLGTTFWKTSPLCVDVKQDTTVSETGETKTQVTVIGYANSIASSYLLLFANIFGFIFLLLQPVGQIVAAFAVVSLLALVEAIDNERDAATINEVFARAARGDSDIDSTALARSGPPSFLSICTLALWGYNLFFSTGHQAVLSAIQWKTAFVGFPVLSYPFSPLLVILNTLGPFILSAAAIPVLVWWNVAPSFKGGNSIPILSNLVTACLGFVLYHTAVTLSSAVFAAHLRRHLMVWKVFAPRFMLSAITLLMVDLVILVICIGWGGRGTLKKLGKNFGTIWR